MNNKDEEIKVSINGDEKNYTIKTNFHTEEDSKEFSWVMPIIPKEEKEKKDNIISMQYYKKEQKKRKIPPLFLAKDNSGIDKKTTRIISSIVGAVVIGILFGVGLLKMMDGSPLWNSKQNLAVLETSANRFEAQLADRKVYLLQFGLFTEEDRAKKALNGKAPFSFSIVQTEEGYRIYIGIFSEDSGQAYWENIANQADYKSFNKTEAYEAKTLSVSTLEYKEFIEKFDVLYTDLLQVTKTFASEESISKEQFDAIQKQMEEIKKLEHYIANEPLLYEIANNINTAVEQVEAEYKESTIENKKVLQKSLLQIYSLYHELYNNKAFT